MNDSVRTVKLSTLLMAAGTFALILAATLGIQFLRDSWPFRPASAAAAGTAAAAPSVAEQHSAHARTAIELDSERMALAGITIEHARVETLAPSLRVPATVVPDEARIVHLHTRVSGWLETLYVTSTGQRLRAGQPLAAIFSQELYASQIEYLNARATAGTAPPSAVIGGARTRLAVLGMSEAEILEIERSGKPHRLVTLTAPRSGVMLRRPVAVGTAVDPSTEIVTVADLSHVWVIAEVPEGESSGIRAGSQAGLDFPSTGHAALKARVEFVSPTLTEKTHTLKVRFGVDNRDGALRPGTYGTAEFVAVSREVLTVPRDAVVDSGDHQHVFVATAPDRLEPRTVTLGLRLADRVEIRSGLVAGDAVVAAGVFLVDSESRLRASGAPSGHAHGVAKSEDRAGHGDH